MKKLHLRYKKQTPRERTWTIHFISLEKTIKGTVLILVAFKMLSLFGSDVHAWAMDFVTRHGIDITNRYVQSALAKLIGVGNTQLVEMSTVALVYSGFLFTEGIGLWLQKRWAEYLTTIATALFIPIEVYELYERFTWVRVSIIVLNVFIVWYLATRLKDEKQELHETEQPASTGTKVKICGITNLDDALMATKYGADDLGFNFYEKSPRHLTPEQAKSIIDAIPSTVVNVGVFVNESPEKICEIARIAGLDAIQLHGDEDNEFIDRLHKMSELPVIKAIRIGVDFNPEDVDECAAEAILLDKYSPTERGGTGESFDWTGARQIRGKFDRIYLAGGLNPENVAEAIREVQPYAVDVASGVESSPGKKDPEKVASFIKAAIEAI